MKNDVRVHLLRPEVVDSKVVVVDYLWRLTKEQKYPDWAWGFVVALERHCRTSNGYTDLSDVYQSENTLKDNVQQSFFFSRNFKIFVFDFFRGRRPAIV